MQKMLSVLAAAALALPLAAAPDRARAQEAADYTVAELLEPCMEGDADARDGVIPETECEQYVRGFTDAFLMFGEAGHKEGICLPDTPARATEIRWAFMRWAHEHYGQREMPAAEGLKEAMKARFKCE